MLHRLLGNIQRRDIQQDQSTENTLRDTVFYRSQENLAINMVKS